jgi:signal transduction histidine kinase
VVRARAQTFVVAGALAVEILVAGLALHILLDWPPRILHVVAAAVVPLVTGLVLSPSARVEALAARLVRPAVSLAGLTSLIAGVYVLVVVGLGRPPTHEQRTLLALSLAAAGISALLYVPARRRLNAFAERLVHGKRETPDAVARAFGARLSRAVPLEELLLQLVELLRQKLGFEAAEIWLLGHGVLERVASDPDRGPSAFRLDDPDRSALARSGVVGGGPIALWVPDLLAERDGSALRVAPVVHGGELFGLIVVEHREDEQPGDDVDDALRELARETGLVLRNVRLDSDLQASLAELRRQAEELRASRARVVAAADEERRRIERDLHDGAQQHLVGLAANLAAVERLIDNDPEEAKGVLDGLQHAVQESMESFRVLAHGVYPPLLEDRGLAEALSHAARSAAVSASVDAPGLSRYDPGIEAAVYFCCLESLQNAAKHAGEGARATVRVRENGRALRFEVEDDGVGLDPMLNERGAGLTNMRDRIGAVGGELRVESTLGGGTRVIGAIPLER